MDQAEREHLADMLVNQMVVDDTPNLAHGHNMMAAQHAQLVGNGRIIAPQASRQIADAQFPLWRIE